MTAQDLYIKDLEHCVRELQRVVDRFRSSAVAAAGLLPSDLCDVLVPQPAAVAVPVNPTDTLDTPASTGNCMLRIYDGRPINKLQNDIILLIFKICI